MNQTTNFFELAALLIPVLMLSGFVTAKLRPPSTFDVVIHKRGGRSVWMTLAVIVGFGILPITAEVMALNAAMGGGAASSFETWVVALAVALGTVSLAVAGLWPWLRGPWSSSRGLRFMLVLLGVLTIVPIVPLLRSGVELQQSYSRLQDARNEAQQARDELQQTREELQTTAAFAGALDPPQVDVLAGHIDIVLRRLDAQRREGRISKRTYLAEYRAYERIWTQLAIGELKALTSRP